MVYVFHGDGTMWVRNPDGTSDPGVWVPTGDQSIQYSLTIVEPNGNLSVNMDEVKITQDGNAWDVPTSGEGLTNVHFERSTVEDDLGEEPDRGPAASPSSQS